MPRANVLARDAGRVAGTGTAPRRLVDLIDAEFLAGIGYGWLPDALIGAELASGELRRIRWSQPATHVFRPHLYHRGAPGPAARRLIEALVGDRDDILEEATRRILGDSKYVKHIYGSDEAGGTSVFFISDVPFEKLGFVAAPKQAMPVLTANALGDGPTVILVGGALLSGLYWITQRRALVALAETRDIAAKRRS